MHLAHVKHVEYPVVVHIDVVHTQRLGVVAIRGDWKRATAQCVGILAFGGADLARK